MIKVWGIRFLLSSELSGVQVEGFAASNLGFRI